MAGDDRLARLTRVRREPPPFRRVELVECVERTPRLVRLTFEGDGLRDFGVDGPAASVRLLVPTAGSDELVIPDWNGNEFILPDGTRPVLRTFTPLAVDDAAGRLDVEVVRHRGGAVSGWVEQVAPGARAAISGPGSGYEFPGGAERLIVLADETALPAATQLIGAAPIDLALELHIEVITPDAVLDVAIRDEDSIEWHVSDTDAVPGGRITDVVRSLTSLPDGTYVWAAGEASAMQAIRTHLFRALGADRRRATVRGYWKPAR